MSSRIEIFGRKEKEVLFYHANGFPPETYKEFIEEIIPEHKVIAPKARPLWCKEQIPKKASLIQFANDLIEDFEKKNIKAKSAIGHSLGGGVLLFAALKKPNLFERLILIDPIMLPINNILLAFIVEHFYKNRLYEKAKKRRTTFNSKEEIFKIYRRKPLFKNFSENALKNYIESAFKKNNNGKEKLIYDKRWEASIFNSNKYEFVHLWKHIEKINIPITIIKAEHNSVIFNRTKKLLKTKKSHIKIKTLEKSSHLMLLEEPKRSYQTIKEEII